VRLDQAEALLARGAAELPVERGARCVHMQSLRAGTPLGKDYDCLRGMTMVAAG
jgi:hypothetical protein